MQVILTLRPCEVTSVLNTYSFKPIQSHMYTLSLVLFSHVQVVWRRVHIVFKSYSKHLCPDVHTTNHTHRHTDHYVIAYSPTWTLNQTHDVCVCTCILCNEWWHTVCVCVRTQLGHSQQPLQYVPVVHRLSWWASEAQSVCYVGNMTPYQFVGLWEYT